MAETDWLMLLIIFVISLISSMLGGIIIRLKTQKRSNNTKTNNINHTTLNQSTNNVQPITPIYPPTMHLNIPPAPNTPPPVSQFAMGWHPSWDRDEDICIGQGLFEYTLDKFTFNQQNYIHSSLLMELIPYLSTDTIKIISSFLSETDLCISKYVLLDCSHPYIQFYMNDLDCKQIKKTMKIPIKTSTSFTKQILNTIHQHYIFSLQTDKPAVCSIYFRNNHNAIITGHYFILSVLSEFDIVSEILCQFGDDNHIHFIRQISMDIDCISAKALNVRMKFDKKYIYGMKGDRFCVGIYDLQGPQQPIWQATLIQIVHFQIYGPYVISDISSLDQCNDYLMISRQNCSKLQLYAIGTKLCRLCHEFELKSIFMDLHKKVKFVRLDHVVDDENICILSFEMDDNDILFCVYFNRASSQLFAANIRLSIFEEAKLINFILLDRVNYPFHCVYSKCLGIEAIHTNGRKDWLVFCELSYIRILYETEFRLDANSLKVKYQVKRNRFLKSHNRKQMSFSKFICDFATK